MLFWFVIIPILTAVILYLLPKGKPLAIIIQAALAVCSVYVFFLSKQGDIITNIGGYSGVLGIRLKADNLSSVFLMLTAFLFTIVAVYNFKGSYNPLFWFLFFVWEGLLIGIFLSSDIFNIFVLLEVATVIVSILIMFKRDSHSMFDGLMYLLINTVAIQLYLFGVGYIYKLTGTLDMYLASDALTHIDVKSLALPYALIATSISLKCALMPLFSWLPKAHGTPGAPASVSALLSGLHIKCGLYLFIRFQSMFQMIDISQFFLVAGVITGILGFVLALAQSDIKMTLAYSTISQIGMVMVGINVGDIYAHTGSVYHIVNHALFKSGLFLTAGMIIDVYGTRNINEIHGVMKRMPVVGIATLMSITGIVGAPFFNGSISKYFIMTAAEWELEIILMLMNLGTIIVFIKYSSMLFSDYSGKPTKTDLYKQSAVLVLAGLCLIGGIFGGQIVELLFNVQLSVDLTGYFKKTASFAVSVAVGFVIYRYYVMKSKLLKRIKQIELGFNGVCVCIAVFFAIMLLMARL